jgi:hypothetical protein
MDAPMNAPTATPTAKWHALWRDVLPEPASQALLAEVADVAATLAIESAPAAFWRHFGATHLRARAAHAAASGPFWRARLCDPSGQLRPIEHWPLLTAQALALLPPQAYTPSAAANEGAVQTTQVSAPDGAPIVAAYSARALQVMAHHAIADDARWGRDAHWTSLWLTPPPADARAPAGAQTTWQALPRSAWPGAAPVWHGALDVTGDAAARGAISALVAHVQNAAAGQAIALRTTTAVAQALLLLGLPERTAPTHWVIDGPPPAPDAFAHAAQTGAALHHRWSCAPLGIYASQCPHERGRALAHACVSQAWIEVLRPDGHACADGEVGDVAVSGLHTGPTPWLRWQTGARARYHAHCPSCGAARPTLAAVDDSP